MNSDYLDQLNPAQREAVTNADGPSMIIAGAGSGKTRVLTYRIAHLIEQGVDSFNILSLTFTNKAAREMRQRIEALIGTEARNIWMGTFHSVFARILRAEGARLGYSSNFTIYDSDDSKSLIRSIVKELNLDEKLYKPNTVLSRISAAKNRLVSFVEYNRNPIYRSDDENAMRPEIGRIYKIYQERLFKSEAMDFDDLLFNTSILFKEHVDVLNKYQDKFRYILVDEFQDTNLSQYYITRKLSSRYRNITVVGDDAQSIYAFRGADIQNILNFEKDYEELKIFKLEQNYRSTQNIVNAANSVIDKNTAQLKKNVWTDNEGGTPINVLSSKSDNEEGRQVANAIYEMRMQEQFQNRDFAILYRTNSQSRSMEEALRRLNINYKIYGGLSFYQRREIRDIVAYLRFVCNSNDEEAFKRIINYPKRGIGTTSVAKILVYANEQQMPLWDALHRAPKLLGGRIGAAIDQFNTLIKHFKLAVEHKDAFDAATQIAKETGILKELYNDKSIEGLNRHENVQELLNGVKEFVDDPEKEDKSLPAFLQEISLFTDADRDDGNADFVSLMTIHASKGLEFKNVFIVGLEEDLFPSQMMLNSRADLEEERRLFYVAVTRAEKNLILSYAITRYRFGRLKGCEPSRFLKEIDPAYLNMKSMPSSPQAMSFDKPEKPAYKQSYSGLLKGIKQQQQQQNTIKSTYTPPVTFKASDTSQLEAGMRVEHPKFGYGVVKSVDHSGSNRKAQVSFNDVGMKTLLLSFAKLRIHS